MISNNISLFADFFFIQVCPSHCVNSACNKSDGNCTNWCNPGHWGVPCHSPCPLTCVEKICNRNTGHCMNCPPGFWGYVCNTTCPQHCYGEVCDQEHGVCIQGCNAGKFGDTCEDNCGHGCVEQTCKQQNGACTGGCLENWAGDRCDSTSCIVNSVSNILFDEFIETQVSFILDTEQGRRIKCCYMFCMNSFFASCSFLCKLYG